MLAGRTGRERGVRRARTEGATVTEGGARNTSAVEWEYGIWIPSTCQGGYAVGLRGGTRAWWWAGAWA